MGAGHGSASEVDGLMNRVGTSGMDSFISAAWETYCAFCQHRYSIDLFGVLTFNPIHRIDPTSF